jgi:parallel beta-helix repeat protein
MSKPAILSEAQKMGTWRKFFGITLTISAVTVVMAMLGMSLMPADAVAAACATSIPDCGCTITAPGTYTLTGASPMNSTDTCIDIAASNVTLDGNSKIINGPGSSSATFGVLVEDTANKVILVDLTAEHFGQGVHVNGPNASTDNVTTTFNKKGIVVNGKNAFLIEEGSISDGLAGIQVNPAATNFVMVDGGVQGAGGAGIFLNGANGAFISNAVAEGDGTFGIWLKSASDNVIVGFIAEDNAIAGIYLGCNPNGLSGQPCPAGEAYSNGNSLTGSAYAGPGVSGENSVVSNTASTAHQHFGVAVDLGNLHNHFTGITGTGNTLEDAADGNGCGSNRWFGNDFTHSSPPKNTSFFCLN